MPRPSQSKKVVRSSGPLVPRVRRRQTAPLASAAPATRPTPLETATSASVVTPNATMIQGIAKAVSEAVIQSLTPFMMSNQSDSASALTEAPVQDAPVNNSPNNAIGADATVQGSVASVIHTLSDSEILTSRSSTHAALSGSYSDSPTTRPWADIVTYLLGSTLQPSSLPTYRHAWRLYNTFSIDILGQCACSLPLPSPNLAIFIAYLYQYNYASSTVNTDVSALGYIHRLAGVVDPTRIFLVWKS